MSTALPPKPFLRRFWIPLSILALGIIVEVVNWSMVLIPTIGRSAQVVLGRNVVMLIAGLLLIWLLFTRQVARKTKYMIFGGVLGLVGIAAASVREIENTGDNQYVIHYRWEKTQDERLAEFKKQAGSTGKGDAAVEAKTVTLNPNAPKLGDFLGTRRDGVVPGAKFVTDWAKSPPKERWRRPVGGGYAACVLGGGLAVTIEQREDNEVVVAYDLQTGNEAWTKAYPGHFKESMGGNGPRATPTIADTEVFALGADGTLAALDLATGKEHWKTNILTDAKATNIQWGMCGAPLVVGDKVIVNPGGKPDHGVVAYDRQTGKKLWNAGNGKSGYASPVLAKLKGQDTILIFDAEAVAGYHPDTGKELWRHPFPTPSGITVAQPLALPGDQVFISAGYDAGALVLQLDYNGDAWSTKPLWQNKKLKCKFSSAVYHKGYLYGMDDGVMACLDAKTGERLWKGGRYGHSQILLRNDLIIIMGENGEVYLVAADPKAHRELTHKPLLPGGKAWNAPSLADNILLLRNHFEAVLLELTPE